MPNASTTEGRYDTWQATSQLSAVARSARPTATIGEEPNNKGSTSAPTVKRSAIVKAAARLSPFMHFKCAAASISRQTDANTYRVRCSSEAEPLHPRTNQAGLRPQYQRR